MEQMDYFGGFIIRLLDIDRHIFVKAIMNVNYNPSLQHHHLILSQ